MKSPIDKSITSADNSLFRAWKDCLTGKGIKKHGQFLIAGEHAVADTLERFPAFARNLLVRGEETPTVLIQKARKLTEGNTSRFSVISLAPALFEELDAAGTHSPILVAETPELGSADLSTPPQGLEVVCALGDPSNLGALLRSAAAFGAKKVILLQESASPFHPKAVRAASAATLAVPLARGPSIKELRNTPTDFNRWVALDMLGKKMTTYPWPKDVRLLLGEEGQGVPEIPGIHLVAIPMAPDVESLNATVASSIALYAYRAQHSL